MENNPYNSQNNPPDNKFDQPLKVSSPLLYYVRFVNGRFVIGIIGTLLLIVGVYAGIQLIQTRQILRQKAASNDECTQSSDCILLENPGDQGSFDALRPINHIVVTAGETISFNPPSGDNGCFRSTINGSSLTWEKYGIEDNCQSASSIQVWLEPTEAQQSPEGTIQPSTSPSPEAETGAVSPSLSCPSGYQELTRYSGDLIRREHGIGKWTNSYNFDVVQDSDIIVSAWSGVGHPESGCKSGLNNDNGKNGCDLGQNFEEFDIYLDSNKIASVPDHGEDKWQFFGNIGPQSIFANQHQITFQHTNRGTTAESVFYAAILCTKAKQLTTNETDPGTQVRTETGSPSPSSSPTIEPIVSPTAVPSGNSETKLSEITDIQAATSSPTPESASASNKELLPTPEAENEIPATRYSITFFGIDFDLLTFLIKLFSVSHGAGRG